MTDGRVTVVCTHCKGNLRVPIGRSGSVNCPHCHKTFSVTTRDKDFDDLIRSLIRLPRSRQLRYGIYVVLVGVMIVLSMVAIDKSTLTTLVARIETIGSSLVSQPTSSDSTRSVASSGSSASSKSSSASWGADFQKGLAAYNSGDYATALREWRPLAEQGNAQAQHNLGAMYFDGDGVPKEYKTAIKWYTLAAEQGNIGGQFNLGQMYRQGKGVLQNYKTAVRWYTLAAEQGNPSSQYTLANQYRTGQGVPQDNKTAVRWYTLAAKQGYVLAQTNLGLMYWNGYGVPQDQVYAHMWFNIAASSGSKVASRNRGILAKTMNPYQLAKAQDLARNFAPRNTTQNARTARQKGSTGTGFFINKQGHIITNSHVVNDCRQINTHYRGSKVSTSLVTNDPTNDLALLKASTTPSVIASFRSGNDIRSGEDILAFGFPWKGFLSEDLKGTKGMVNALAGLGNDTRFLQMSAPVQPGNSGGPLLDQAGNVVGVVTARMSAVKMAKYSGAIPQNVNFALKTQLVTDLLDVYNIDYKTSRSWKDKKTVDIFDKAKKFTVLVECLQ